eukprot:7657273-Pyramimonas_sp.AAC.1
MRGMRWLGRLMKQRSIVDSFLLASDLCVVEGVAISMTSRNSLRQKTGWRVDRTRRELGDVEVAGDDKKPLLRDFVSMMAKSVPM